MRILCLVLSAASLLSAADRKRVMPVAKAGVTTPGVQMPFSKLKAEAEIAIAGAASILGFAETVWVGTASGVIPVDAKTTKAGERVAGVKHPCAGLATGFDTTWVPDCADKTIARFQAKTNEVKSVIAAGAFATAQGVAATDDSIWALTDDKGTISRIDPESGKVVAENRLPAGCNSLLFAEKALWVTCPATNQLLRMDPLTNLVDKRIDVAADPRSQVFAEGSIWVLGSTKGSVSRVDPKTNKVTTTIELAIPNAEGEITAGAGSVWVTAKGFPITRIDPKTDQVMQQFAGEGGGALRFGTNSLWLVNVAQQTVWRIDPKRVLATFAE